MHKPNLSAVVQLMRGAVDRMQKEGAIKSREDRIVRLREVFPFRPEDVESVSHAGNGGVRFRLQNGRSFDGNGQPADGP